MWTIRKYFGQVCTICQRRRADKTETVCGCCQRVIKTADRQAMCSSAIQRDMLEAGIPVKLRPANPTGFHYA